MRRRKGKRRTAFRPIIPRSAFASDKGVRLEKSTGRAGAQPLAYARFEVNLHAARNILCRRPRVDFGEICLHLRRNIMIKTSHVPSFKSNRREKEKKGGLRGRSAMGRFRDTSSRAQRKGKDQLRFGKREWTHSIVVEPVLSKEHFPKVLADLVPCL